jgi:hypothetical protein
MGDSVCEFVLCTQRIASSITLKVQVNVQLQVQTGLSRAMQRISH